MNDEVAVGDLNSDEKGSGARKNAGKAQLDLVPVYVWRKAWTAGLKDEKTLSFLLGTVDAWQKGDDDALYQALPFVPPTVQAEAVKVLEFGAKKYKAWNWAKGMPWSVPTGCILRHSLAILNGERTDPESGCSHLGHIFCNILMLIHYVKNYPEGDDRPPFYHEVIPDCGSWEEQSKFFV